MDFYSCVNHNLNRFLSRRIGSLFLALGSVITCLTSNKAFLVSQQLRLDCSVKIPVTYFKTLCCSTVVNILKSPTHLVVVRHLGCCEFTDDFGSKVEQSSLESDLRCSICGASPSHLCHFHITIIDIAHHKVSYYCEALVCTLIIWHFYQQFELEKVLGWGAKLVLDQPLKANWSAGQKSSDRNIDVVHYVANAKEKREEKKQQLKNKVTGVYMTGMCCRSLEPC